MRSRAADVENQNPYRPPASPGSRAKNFLLYGFAISIVLHLLLGPFVKFERTQAQEETPHKVQISKIPTPPPTPPPTPTPKPTPPPTPPPHETPPPKQTPSPVQPRLKINTIKTHSDHTSTSQLANNYKTGNTQANPEGIGTGPPVPSAPPATPAPPPPTPKPLSCARPNVQPGTDRAIEPDMPAMAQQMGITGDVTVIIALDENNHITNASVESSPSKILNNAAITAAKQSTFHTEIKDCKPVAASYRFVVTFASQ